VDFSSGKLIFPQTVFMPQPDALSHPAAGVKHVSAYGEDSGYYNIVTVTR